jgi:hypothetical protein
MPNVLVVQIQLNNSKTRNGFQQAIVNAWPTKIRPGLQAMASKPGFVWRGSPSGSYLRFGSTVLAMYIVSGAVLMSSGAGQCQVATPVLSGSSSDPFR